MRQPPGPPAWAMSLVAGVCAEAGIPPPLLRWRRADRAPSSGVTRKGAGLVAVTAGTDPLDQHLTLLHELAHWLGPEPRRRRRGRIAHHDQAFYSRTFALYATHGIELAEAVAREGARHPGALRHARDLGMPGAAEAYAAHREILRQRAAFRRPPRIIVPEHQVRLVRDGRWTRCAVCGVRIVGPVLARLRRRPGSHLLLATG
jgi:hypothetical protein